MVYNGSNFVAIYLVPTNASQNSTTFTKICMNEEVVTVFSREVSILFQLIIWPILVTGLIGNLAVLVRLLSPSSKQNTMHQPCYRCFLFSFALSDLLVLITAGVSTLTIVKTRKIVWIYTDWVCKFMPFLQTVGVLTGSWTLAGVAINRYIAMEPKYPRAHSRIRKWVCPIFFVLFTWCSAAAASYLILEIYYPESICMIKGDTYYLAKVCMAHGKSKINYIYTSVFVIIFLPLGLIFIVVHILLAVNIWQRNKLAKSEFSDRKDIATVSSSVKPNRTRKRCANSRQRTLQKNRIVKIILILIVLFGVCRLPAWIFVLCKFHLKLSSWNWWYVQVVIGTLSCANATIDPILYAFLNEFLSFKDYVKSKFVKKRVPHKYTFHYNESAITKQKIPREPTV